MMRANWRAETKPISRLFHIARLIAECGLLVFSESPCCLKGLLCNQYTADIAEEPNYTCLNPYTILADRVCQSLNEHVDE